MRPPEPLVPAHPGWLAAYWQSWRAGQPDTAADGVLAQVRSLRARGLDDEAFVVACEFMDRAASEGGAEERHQPEMAQPWPALATLLIEEVIGVTWSQASINWALRLAPPVGLHGLEIGGNAINLTAEADTGAGIVVMVEATAPLDLTIQTEFTTFQERTLAGQARYLLTYLDRTDIFIEG